MFDVYAYVGVDMYAGRNMYVDVYVDADADVGMWMEL